MNTLINDIVGYSFILNQNTGMNNEIVLDSAFEVGKQVALVQYSNQIVLMRVFTPFDPDDTVLEISVQQSVLSYFAEYGTILKVWKVGVLAIENEIVSIDGKVVGSMVGDYFWCNALLTPTFDNHLNRH